MKCELHNYQTIRDCSEVKIDVCKQCKKRTVFRKDKQGRIDNEHYRKEHQRDFLQRTDKLYNKYYGKKN